MVKEKSSNSRIFDKDGYRKVSFVNCKILLQKKRRKIKKREFLDQKNRKYSSKLKS